MDPTSRGLVVVSRLQLEVEPGWTDPQRNPIAQIHETHMYQEESPWYFIIAVPLTQCNPVYSFVYVLRCNW